MLKPAICTQCGANIEVDASHEAGVCKFCGTAFITEKAINNYITNHSTVHNVTENVTKIILGNEKDEGSDHFKRGVTFLKLAQYGEASDAFEKACKLSPERAEYWFYQAVADSQNFTVLAYNYNTIFSHIKNFLALATDEEKMRLTQEFEMDFSNTKTSILIKTLNNLTVNDDKFICDQLYCLKDHDIYSDFCDTTVANALANLLLHLNSLPYFGIELAISRAYSIILSHTSNDTANKVKLHLAYILNHVVGSTLELVDDRLLIDPVTQAIHISTPEIEYIKGTEHNKYVDAIIITPNIHSVDKLHIDKTIFENGVTEFTIKNVVTATHKLAILPDTDLPKQNNYKFKPQNPCCIIFSKNNFDLNFFSYNPTASTTCRLGGIINGKIIYPIPYSNTEFKYFNENLLEYFGKEIESGEITGFIENPDQQNTKKGCYVATCVYGSYDCPEVWTLRRYRDEKLAKSTLGRLFIKLYYAVSPKIVKLFGRYKWFNRFFKKRLDKKVKKLRGDGFESTPYDDPKY